MPKKIRINTELNAGRPRTAINKSELPEKTTTGELPKRIVGSHMGMMLPAGPKTQGPAIGKPAKLPPRPKKAPPV